MLLSAFQTKKNKMTTFVHSFSSRQVLCIDHVNFKTVGELKAYLSVEKGVPKDATFFVCNGRLVKDAEPVKRNVVYHTHLRLPGGKGGFGSMLRAIGAQIEKTTNHEACRDLSGRRMRDVNNEKDLKEWLGKQAERESERERKRQERIARRRAMPNHKFDDPLYHEQRSLLAENQEDAIQKGLKKVIANPGPSATVTSEEMLGVKRKSETQGPSGSGKSKKKKAAEWLGLDIDNLSDLDSDDDTSNSEESTKEQIIPGADKETQMTREDSNSGDLERIGSYSLNERDRASQIPHSENLIDAEDRSCGKSDTSSSVLNGLGNSKDGDNKTNAELERENTTESSTIQKEVTQPKESVQIEKPFCLDDVTSMQELEQLGLDRLKQELMDRGLKCGGTLQQRAERLFSVKGLTRDQIDVGLFAKSADGKKVKNRK